MGPLLYYLFPFRKATVLSNLRLAFPAHSDRDIRKLAKAFYAHMASSIWENLKLKFMTEEQIASRVTIKGVEHVLEAAKKGKGVAILTGHFGNWEFAPIGGILNFKEYQGRFHVIRKTLKNKFIERLLFHRYNKAGLKVIPKKNALQGTIDALAANDAVIFIMDQHASLEVRDGIAVEFFGKPAGTYRSLAMIARNTGAAVVPMRCYRVAKGRHVLEFLPEVPYQDLDSAREALQVNTRVYNQVLEEMVAAHPAQWLWLHRRWKV